MPKGWFITDIDSWGLDIAMIAIQTSSSAIDQGKSALFLWETTNVNTFYRGPIYLPDPIATSLMNINGRLYIWSGDTVKGVRLSEYIGGSTVSEICFYEDGQPPFAGACDARGGRIAWWVNTSYPNSTASVLGFGSKNDRLQKDLHNIAKTSSAGANGLCSALKYVQQGSDTQKLILGWRDDANTGIDKYSTTATYASKWRSKVFAVGSPFSIEQVRIPFGKVLASNMTLTVKIYYDDASASKTLTTINSTNYSGRKVLFKQQEIIDSDITPDNNFFLELSWTGTVKLPVIFPIEIVIDRKENEAND